MRLGALYPFYSGCGTLANTRPFRHLTRGMTEPVLVRLRGGPVLYVMPSDYVGRAVLFFRDLDPKVTWACRRLLRSGDTFLDIGANQGLVSMYAAARVGPSGWVHAIEPQPELVALMRRTVAANRMGNVVVHPIALSDAAGKLTLAVPEDNGGRAHLCATAGQGERAVAVEVRRTDEFLRSAGVSRAQLVKIDVEGHEEQVFRGGMEFLSDPGPDAIIFESFEEKPFLERSAVGILHSLRYRFAELPKTLGTPRPRWVEGGSRPAAHDFVAINPRSKRDPAAALGLEGAGRR